MVASNKEIVLILPRETSITHGTFRQSSDTLGYKTNVSLTNNYEVFREPLGIECIKGYLNEKGFSVKLFFPELEEISDEEIIEYISTHEIALVGFSVLFDRHLQHAMLLSSKIKECGKPVYFGGPFASLAAEELLKVMNWIDGIVIGEGELTLYRLVQALVQGDEWREIPGLAYTGEDGQYVKNPKSDKINLESFPRPARDYLEILKEKGLHSGIATIFTSRGCPELCTYCTGNKLTTLNKGKTWRTRPVTEVVDEMEYLQKEFNTTYIYVCDDNFFGYGKDFEIRLREIAAEIIKRKIKITFHYECRVDAVNDDLLQTMNEAGFRDILLGIEAGSQAMLDRWKKRITVDQNKLAISKVHKLGLELKPGFILFDQQTTLAELKENLQFIKDTNMHQSQYIFDLFNPIQIFKGSELEQHFEKEREYKKITSSPEEINRFVVDYCDFSYECKEEEVKLFWHISKPLIDKLDYQINYNVFGKIIEMKRKRKALDKIISFVGTYKKWKNDIGEILIDILLLILERVSQGIDVTEIEEEITEAYRKIEANYFPAGMEVELAKLAG